MAWLLPKVSVTRSQPYIVRAFSLSDATLAGFTIGSVTATVGTSEDIEQNSGAVNVTLVPPRLIYCRYSASSIPSGATLLYLGVKIPMTKSGAPDRDEVIREPWKVVW
jgi:hypothetical protein